MPVLVPPTRMLVVFFLAQLVAAVLNAEAKVLEDPQAAEGQEADGVAEDASEAKIAADSAKEAAHVAKQVAAHSIRMTRHAKAALKHAQEALHDTRIEAEDSLSDNQTQALKKAEEHLREASKLHQFGKGNSTEAAQQEEALRKKLDRLKQKMESESKQSIERKSELAEMREELHEMRKRLSGTVHEKQIGEIEDMLKEMEEQGNDAAVSHDELKAELERLRDVVRHLEQQQEDADSKIVRRVVKEGGDVADDAEEEEKHGDHDSEEGKKHGHGGKKGHKKHKEEEPPKEPKEVYEIKEPEPKEAAPEKVDSPIDIDTEMPYGDLEPFGREDTAQELTEASIRESDRMVDQLERAEVAEEKRAIFRALTRLRGAAITSFDGVARSQTGNIDGYNQVHRWRGSHPLHHLADEESDVSKWAFPNANL
mmetsp:Transcript_12012/g.28162  ORF Transcript_12012/g.28162 Transcript_12012/m.28162 type:complete len:425 (-) Transcript_12012:222-1496(-)